MKRLTSTACAAVICIVLSAISARGQQVSYNWVPGGVANWNINNNWFDPVNNQNFVPDATQYEERAVINNGGTAFVAAGDNPTPPGAILIQDGTAEVRSGGSLDVRVTPAAMWDGSVTVNGAGNLANLNVLPGGTLTTQGLLQSAANSANTITIGGTTTGTATVNVPAAVFQGTTRVFPNAAFTSTGSVNFSTGPYTPEINGANAASLNIGQNAILGGTLNANFSGPLPSVGDRWELLEADSIVNSFFSVTSNLSFPANQRLMTNVFSAGNNRYRLDLELSEVLILNVNRDTGEVAIDHSQGTSGINLDSYSITSSQGRLVAGNLSSVSNQGALGGNWDVATINSGSISELRPTGDGTAAATTSVSLGSVYDPLAGDFASVDNDLAFEYSDSDGRLIDGIVNYSGTTVNNLLLQIDPDSGKTQIRNTSGTTVDVIGYVISSAASLAPGTWDSLEDQGAAGGDWLEFLNPSSAQVGEVKVADSTTIAPGTTFDLGTVFNVNATQDLTFEFLLLGDEVATFGAVIYEPIGDADFDGDGDVDGTDFLIWQRGFGLSGQADNMNGDANADGVVDSADLAIWQSQNGQAAATQALVATVPEPSGYVLSAMLSAGVILSLQQRRRLSYAICQVDSNSSSTWRSSQER